MSELLIEHPIPIIDDLLKSRIGDEGRLLYLRKAITGGNTIHESDRKYLKRMQEKIWEHKAQNTKFKKKSNFENQNIMNIKNKIDNQDSPSVERPSNVYDDFESEITKIKNSLLEVKSNNSKIRDNLELLLLNREILTKDSIAVPASFSNLTKSTTSEMFDLIKDNTNFKNFSLFGIKKHDAMTFASAGLFSLWYAGYQNVIDLGPLQGITLGLSAGAAVSAGLFYKNYKKPKKSIFKNKKL